MITKWCKLNDGDGSLFDYFLKTINVQCINKAVKIVNYAQLMWKVAVTQENRTARNEHTWKFVVEIHPVHTRYLSVRPPFVLSNRKCQFCLTSILVGERFTLMLPSSHIRPCDNRSEWWMEAFAASAECCSQCWMCFHLWFTIKLQFYASLKI